MFRLIYIIFSALLYVSHLSFYDFYTCNSHCIITGWYFSSRRRRLSNRQRMTHSICYVFKNKYKVTWSGVRVPAGAGNFSFHHRVQNGSGARPASYPMGTRGSSPGVKAAGGEADHLPPSNAAVKNAWNCTSTRTKPSRRGGQLKRKHKDNFNFAFC
jgi:hypothetical protein